MNDKKKRPTVNQCMMQTAKIWGQRGTCPRASVGSVISKNGRIISVGYIGSPSGQPHCYDEGCIIEDKNEGCIRGIHSEINSIGFAARRGIATEGAIMYVTRMPCLRCSMAILASGIAEVYYLEDHRDQRGVKYLRDNGIKIEKYLELK